MASETRTARAAEAASLRAAGLTQREIAERMKVGRGYVADLLSDPTGERAAARRESYRGTCEVCGARTNGHEGRALAPTRCLKHNRGAEIMRSRAGTGPLQTWIIGLLRVNGPMRFMSLVAASGTTRNTTQVTLVHMVQAGHIRRLSRGLYATLETPRSSR